MEIVFQLLLDALLLSGFYTVLSVGFSLMWGVTGIINLAYGSFIILGAYLSYMIYMAGFDVLLFLPLIFILGFLLGLFFQALFVNRLMGYEPFTILVLTFGFDVVITNLLNLIFKADIRSISLPFENFSLFIADFTLVCPFFSKKLKKSSRISCPVMEIELYTNWAILLQRRTWLYCRG